MEAYRSNLSHQANKSEEERKNRRKKNILLLIYDFLQRNGYLNAALQLKNEVGFDFDDFEVCDNINLEMIMQDFESYYFLKYQVYAQICKKLDTNSKPPGKKGPKKPRQPLSVPGAMYWNNHKIRVNGKLEPTNHLDDNGVDNEAGKLIQPLGIYSNLDLNNEWRMLAEMVCHEILLEHPNISWDQVIGHENAKEALREALVYPLKYPDLYSIVTPWRGILLYGPTGTGKTMLAKAAATQCNATFFNLSPAVLTSKWRGDSEKIVKVLFDLAVQHYPSVIFLDEVDCLVSQRVSQEHEASRRFKSELLARLDGFSSHEKPVFLLCASNFPWDIDVSMLRRMERRIYIPLPSKDERIVMLKNLIPSKIAKDKVSIRTKVNYEEIADLTDDYSGADLQLLSKEIKMTSIRKAIQHAESFASESHIGDGDSFCLYINNQDVTNALTKIKPAYLPILKRYEEFTSACGS